MAPKQDEFNERYERALIGLSAVGRAILKIALRLPLTEEEKGAKLPPLNSPERENLWNQVEEELRMTRDMDDGRNWRWRGK